MALNSLGVSFSHSFSSDINPAAQETLKHNYSSPHHVLYRDLTERCLADVPAVDWYHAGFPCQPFRGRSYGLKKTHGAMQKASVVFFRHGALKKASYMLQEASASKNVSHT